MVTLRFGSCGIDWLVIGESMGWACGGGSACVLVTVQCRSELGFLFFDDPATTELYTLSLHGALPVGGARPEAHDGECGARKAVADRYSRLEGRL